MKLPDGWTSEERDFGKSIQTIIERPGVACVTVDFNLRAYSGGVGFYRPISATKYTGRGWRDRLVADAVKWLGAP